MLVFNCTKAAADFFTRIQKGEKISPIEPAPHKTIAESIAKTRSMTEKEAPWHWLVHVKKIQRINVLVAMDYHSRFSITLSGLKKGEEMSFVKQLELHLIVHVHEIMALVEAQPEAIKHSLDQYYHQHQHCTFYQRGDRSVQSHINDVFWHLQRSVDETGEVLTDLEWINFDDFVNEIIRIRPTEKDYFYPQHEFLHTWLIHYSQCSEAEADHMIKELKAKEHAPFQARYDV